MDIDAREPFLRRPAPGSILAALLVAFAAACGSAAPPAATEAELVMHVPCVTPPCPGDEPEPPPEPAPAVLTGRPPITTLALGHGQSCALTEDGAVWCWGNAQPGDDPDDRWIPARIPSLPPMAALWAGQGATCARARDDGQLFCWGATGLPTTDGDVTVLPFRGVRTVALGREKGCFVDASGDLFCWGSYGGTWGPRWDGPQRVRVPGGGVSGAGLAQIRGCAVGRRGRPVCWGQRPHDIDYERLGGGDFWTYDGVARVQRLAFFDAPQAYPIVLEEGGRVWAMERGEQHGYGSEHRVGRRLVPLDDVVQLAVGGGHACVRTSGGV
ncbi:MAG TPA: RCC1 domain-containing protein, partial [Sandaracinaceae bacterium LLY-WYZ-13_1]|nr:RCC1 domain-containing protein [Sandaracinaceae bacterium LLY-WYZ-13_1]